MRRLLPLFLIAPVLSFAQQRDCFFDQEAQTDDFVKSVPEFVDYTWNSDTKEATISLPGEEVLIAQRGGCYHFGVSGTLITQDPTALEDIEYWFQRGLWIAERLFDKADVELLRKWKEDGRYRLLDRDPYYLVFSHDAYSDLSIVWRKKDNEVELFIGYYM